MSEMGNQLLALYFLNCAMFCFLKICVAQNVSTSSPILIPGTNVSQIEDFIQKFGIVESNDFNMSMMSIILIVQMGGFFYLLYKMKSFDIELSSCCKNNSCVISAQRPTVDIDLH